MKRFSQQGGAFFVELALTMPIFLALVLFVIWFSIVSNSESALTSATINAPFIARARAREEYNLIPLLNDFAETQNLTDAHRDLLFYGIPRSDVSFANTLRFSNPAGIPCSSYTAVDDSNHPAIYTYTLAYALSEMRASIGNDFKFPCDPRGTGPIDGAGCMQCYFEEPSTLNENFFPSGWDCAVSPLATSFQFVCEYKPSNKLFNLLSRLIGQATNNPEVGVLTRRGGLS